MAQKFSANLKKAWQAWKRIGRKVATFQARVLLTVLYFTIFAPFGLILRRVSDTLHIKARPDAWLKPDAEAYDMAWARKQ